MKEQVFSHPALLLSSGVTSVGFNVSHFLTNILGSEFLVLISFLLWCSIQGLQWRSCVFACRWQVPVDAVLYRTVQSNHFSNRNILVNQL